MKLPSSLKKPILILSLVPFFSLAGLYTDTSSLMARGAEGHRGAEEYHPATRHNEDPYRNYNQQGMEDRGAYNRGMEAGAVEGAGAAGGVVTQPVYVQPTQPQVQYVPVQQPPPK